jgi:hypothetical protein
MISSYLLLPIIEKERQHDLERWQLVRAARMAQAIGPTRGRVSGFVAALVAWVQGEPDRGASIECIDGACGAPACC